MTAVVLHTLAALVSLLATLLYAERSVQLQHTGTQNRWSHLTRAGIFLLSSSVVGSFVNLAVLGDPFALRHAAVLAAMALIVIGHLGMRATNTPPT